MKKPVLLILALGLLVSCGGPEKASETASVVSEKDSLKTREDTFSIGNKLFTIEKISREDFDKVPEVQMPDTSEKNLIQKNKDVVSRNGLTLILTIGQNKLPFKNTEKDADDFENYKYQGFLADINQHMILGAYIESFNYILIDATTADTNIVWGIPVVSPDMKYFICGSVDLMAGWLYNGFDLYVINGKKIKRIGQSDLSKWGPQKVKWLDNSSLLVQRTILDTTSSTMTRTDYVKLLMK